MFRTICYAGLAGVAVGAAYKIYKSYFASVPVIAPPEVEEDLAAATEDNPPVVAIPSVNVQGADIPPVVDDVAAPVPDENFRTKRDQWHDKRRARLAKHRAKKAARDAVVP